MNTITELRSVLFETLQSVKAGNMEIDRAKAISELSQTIINTAKAEIRAPARAAHRRPSPDRAQPRQPDGSRREEIGMSCGEHEKAAKTEHTPEPWRVGRRGNDVVGSNGFGDTVAMMIDCDSDEQTHANARRIVACVNACAGMTNEQIDNVCMISGSLLNRFGEQMAYLGQVEKQRDELLEAIEDLYVEFERTREWGCLPMAMVKARAAIANAKGGAA